MCALHMKHNLCVFVFLNWEEVCSRNIITCGNKNEQHWYQNSKADVIHTKTEGNHVGPMYDADACCCITHMYFKCV